MLNIGDMPAYTAAKAGIVGLTKGLAGRYGPDNIRVNAIAPGWVITERQRELWVTEEKLDAHVARQCIPRDDAGRGHGRAGAVPGLGRLADADGADADRRWRISVSGTMPAIAAVDWGTTRLRVWLLDAAGTVLDERRSDDGLLTAQQKGFADVLERHLGDMGAPPTCRSIVCGMAGARQGWVEAPYVDVPASIDDILGAAVPVPGPGATSASCRGWPSAIARAPDVMRGEETQLAGAA